MNICDWSNSSAFSRSPRTSSFVTFITFSCRPVLVSVLDTRWCIPRQVPSSFWNFSWCRISFVWAVSLRSISLIQYLMLVSASLLTVCPWVIAFTKLSSALIPRWRAAESSDTFIVSSILASMSWPTSSSVAAPGATAACSAAMRGNLVKGVMDGMASRRLETRTDA